jgi:hypothetical protein
MVISGFEDLEDFNPAEFYYGPKERNSEFFVDNFEVDIISMKSNHIDYSPESFAPLTIRNVESLDDGLFFHFLYFEKNFKVTETRKFKIRSKLYYLILVLVELKNKQKTHFSSSPLKTIIIY